MTNGQNVFTKFNDTLVYDDFSSNKYNFPQKYTALEISIIDDGNYRIKRISDNGSSYSYLKLENPLYSYEVQTSLSIGTGGQSAGIILNGQTTVNGGILLEVNNKKRFRVTKMNGMQERLLSGSPSGNGWVKSKSLKKKSFNQITVKVQEGYYDIYFNGKYEYTATDTQFESGKVGLFTRASTEVLVTDFLVKKRSSSQAIGVTQNTNQPKNNTTAESNDPDFQEVIMIFKTKIDQQQVEISTLQKDLDRCKSMLNYDTTLVSRSTTLEYNNKILSEKLDSTTKIVTRNKKRLEYLESLKEDVEKGSNGDLVLNLTSILADLKNENQQLKAENRTTKEQKEQVKKDNTVLLREIERLKYMLDLKE